MPAAVTWMVIGLLVNLAPLSRVALVLIVVYGTYYGLVEAIARPGLAPPGSRWQVPAPWVRDIPKWRRALVWGALLGPGFATRNPYAGFWMLPLVVAAMGNLRAGIAFAAALGVLHSSGRAAALLRDVRAAASADYLQSVIRSMRWRTFDGLALLAVTGLGITIAAIRL